MKRLTPFRVQKFLAGLRYPAGKEDVLACAETRGADEQVMSALHRLPEDGEFDSPISLSCEVGRRAQLHS